MLHPSLEHCLPGIPVWSTGERKEEAVTTHYGGEKRADPTGWLVYELLPYPAAAGLGRQRAETTVRRTWNRSTRQSWLLLSKARALERKTPPSSYVVSYLASRMDGIMVVVVLSVVVVESSPRR